MTNTPTPEQIAADLVDNACLPEQLASVATALKRDIAQALRRPDVVERIVKWLAEEFPCGQDDGARADNDCKKIWLPYKKRCPECACHPGERREMAERLTAAIQVQQGVPEGWKLVPERPTEAMMDAAHQVDPYHYGRGVALVVVQYRAMVEASPSPSTQHNTGER